MGVFVTEFQIHRLVYAKDGARLHPEKVKFWKLIGTMSEPNFVELAKRINSVVEEFAKENKLEAAEERFLPR